MARPHPVLALVLALLACAGCGGGGEAPAPGAAGVDPAPEVDPLYLAVLEALAPETRTGTGPGRWRAVPEHLRTGAGEAADREALGAIGYAGDTGREAVGTGITVHDRDAARPGLNLVTSGHAPEAALVEMDGSVLHTWRRGLRDVWPDHPAPRETPGHDYWRRAALLPDGGLIVIFEGLGIIKLDRDSNVVWANPIHAHHDLEPTPDGGVWVLTRRARPHPDPRVTRTVLEDFVTRLDADGEVVESVSLLACFEGSRYRDLLEPAYERFIDLFHANSLVILDAEQAAAFPGFSAGDAIVSLRELHVVACVDLGARTVRWAQQGPFRHQHDPTPVAGGRLLVFDNGGGGEGRSRLLEIDPSGGPIAWSYAGSDESPFFSSTCGAAQRLPGGNTLVTETDAGRAFEITPGGRIVWEYLSPYRGGKDDAFVATLFEVRRLDPDFPTEWLR